MANYCNVPGVQFIYHGDWADPELIYKDHVFNAHDVEDSLWDEFQEQTDDHGTAEEYAAFVHAHPALLTDLLDDIIAFSETETAC